MQRLPELFATPRRPCDVNRRVFTPFNGFAINPAIDIAGSPIFLRHTNHATRISIIVVIVVLGGATFL